MLRQPLECVKDGLAQRKQKIRRRGIARKGQLLHPGNTENKAAHFLPSGTLFQGLQGAQVGESLALHLGAQGGQRLAARAGVDEERVARREGVPAVRHGERVDERAGIRRIVEIVPPLQEAAEPVQVEQNAHHAVSRARHREEAVRDGIALRAAVVHPERIDLRVEEGPDVIARADGLGDDAAPVKFEAAHRVDDMAALEQIGGLPLRGEIALEVGLARLVGDMEKDVLPVIAEGVELLEEGGQEGLEEGRQQGRESTTKEYTCRMLSHGMSPAEIADLLGEDRQMIDKIAAEFRQETEK